LSKKHSPSKKSTHRRLPSTRKRFPSWIWIVLAAVAVIAVVAVILISRKPAAEPSPNEISISQAHEKYQQGVFFLDVRTQAEWDSYHIPNTTLIPLEQLGARVNEVPQDREVVVVCRTGNRSKTGRDLLVQAGYDQVTHMSGGVNAWQSAGYPIEAPNP